MSVNFSAFNMEYFLAVRDVINENPAFAAALFGASPDFLHSLAELTPHQVAKLAYVTMPLVVPRAEPTWWPRFMRALADGDPHELTALSEEAAYYLIQPSLGRER
jgi:hypothetical protein